MLRPAPAPKRTIAEPLWCVGSKAIVSDTLPLVRSNHRLHQTFGKPGFEALCERLWLVHESLPS